MIIKNKKQQNLKDKVSKINTNLFSLLSFKIIYNNFIKKLCNGNNIYFLWDKKIFLKKTLFCGNNYPCYSPYNSAILLLN